MAPLVPFPTPDTHFDRILLDLVDPLPSFRGFLFLLACVECFIDGLILF